jgi:glycosyltransferase involved in cell wall biosynthesis
MKFTSITTFFPAYNDAGTIASMVILAMQTLPALADDYEVVVINDGSQDHTGDVLAELVRLFPRLRVVTHDKNRGYGGAVRAGFAAARSDWVFYTDGDAQYDPRELALLVAAQRDGADVVNGYKIARSDPLHRKIVGRIYHHFVRLTFGIRLRDVDCDFRLLRRAALQRIVLDSTDGTICVELVRKLQDAGCRFVEVPVHHYHRAYGKSQFFNFRRLARVVAHLAALWWRLHVHKS